MYCAIDLKAQSMLQCIEGGCIVLLVAQCMWILPREMKSLKECVHNITVCHNSILWLQIKIRVTTTLQFREHMAMLPNMYMLLIIKHIRQITIYCWLLQINNINKWQFCHKFVDDFVRIVEKHGSNTNWEFRMMQCIMVCPIMAAIMLISVGGGKTAQT